ncbi:hypothetical protein ACWEOE_37240 [Amycolatopsis sp. NPDC004368]
MSAKNVDAEEVARVNRSGRLHPSQRWKVLGGPFLLALVCLVFAVIELLRVPGGPSGYVYGGVAIIVILAFGAFCVSRLLLLAKGTVTTFTGFTHDVGYGKVPVKPYPILLHASKSRGGNPIHSITFDGRTMHLYGGWYRKFQPEHDNTIVLTPNGKVIVNVIPA